MDVKTGKVMLVTSINLYQHRKKEETTYSYSLPAEDQQDSGDCQQEDRSEAQDQNRGHLIINISRLHTTNIIRISIKSRREKFGTRVTILFYVRSMEWILLNEFKSSGPTSNHHTPRTDRNSVEVGVEF